MVIYLQSTQKAALEIRAFRNSAKNLVKCEERGVMLNKLMSLGVGLRQLELNRMSEEQGEK